LVLFNLPIFFFSARPIFFLPIPFGNFSVSHLLHKVSVLKSSHTTQSRRDSISRPKALQAETKPLAHDARADVHRPTYVHTPITTGQEL
jgi:hypothetical protein